MSFRYKASGRALFLVWHTVVTLEDVAAAEQLFTAARKAAGAQLVAVGVISAHVRSHPDADTRAAMSRVMPTIAEKCEAIHVVAEGDDFQRKLLRGLFRAILRVAGILPMQMHSTVGSALAAAGKLAPEDVLAAYEAAQHDGLIDGRVQIAG